MLSYKSYSLRLFHQFIFVVLSYAFISFNAWAWPPLFGPEFTFTNSTLESAAETPNSVVTSANLKALNQWKSAIEKICQGRQDCNIKETKDKHGKAYRIQYADGFWYEVGLDTGVIEVKTDPRTVGQFRELKQRLQKDIFELAHSLDLTPHERLGQGHLNIGLESAFGEDTKLFRNFFVDQANHPELHLGVLGIHDGNAPTISGLGEGPQEALKKVISEFDHHPTDFHSFSRAIEKYVYTFNPYGWKPSYYQNQRLSSINRDLPIEQQRIEIRGIRPQTSVDEFILESELYEKRLEWLKKQSEPIKLIIPPKADMPAAEIRHRYRLFLQETGLNIDKFETILPKELKAVSPDASSIAFDEIHASALQTRDHYKRVEEVSKNLSPEQIKDFQDKAFKTSLEERQLYHVPRVLTQKENDHLLFATNQRGRALKAFFEDLNSGKNEVLIKGIIPPDIFKRLLNKSETSLEKIKNTPWDRTGFSYAPDIARHSDGQFYIMEDNIGNTGGMGDAIESRRDLLKLIPKYQEIFREGENDSYAKKIAESLRAMAKDPKDALVFLIPSSKIKSYSHLIRQLEKFGVYTITERDLDNRKMDVSSGEVILKFYNGERVERSLKVGAAMMRGFSRSDFVNSFPKTYEAFSDGKIAILGYPFSGFDILDDKEFSKYGEDLVRFYLKEEPLIKYIPTISFREVGPGNLSRLKKDNFDNVFDNISKYVIKVTNGAQGEGIFIGSHMNKASIHELQEKIKTEPGMYVAQEYIPLSTVDDQIVDLRTFCAITKNGVYTSDQPWGRSLSVYGDGRVNLSQKGKVIPIFIDGRDSVPKGNVTIPDDPRQLNIREPVLLKKQNDQNCSGLFSRLYNIFK